MAQNATKANGVLLWPQFDSRGQLHSGQQRCSKKEKKVQNCRRNQVEIPSTNINSHVQSIVLYPKAAVRLPSWISGFHSRIFLGQCVFKNFTSALRGWILVLIYMWHICKVNRQRPCIVYIEYQIWFSSCHREKWLWIECDFMSQFWVPRCFTALLCHSNINCLYIDFADAATALWGYYYTQSPFFFFVCHLFSWGKPVCLGGFLLSFFWSINRIM